jgi:hypothetical protein
MFDKSIEDLAEMKECDLEQKKISQNCKKKRYFLQNSKVWERTCDLFHLFSPQLTLSHSTSPI